MRALASVALIGLLSIGASGCAPGPVSPAWRVDADTPVTGGYMGIAPVGQTLSLIELGQVPQPEAARSCGHSSRIDGVVAALRPGVGARIRVSYWTNSVAGPDAGNGTAGTMPSATQFDFVLRLVSEQGSLRADEDMFLKTLLLTNRLPQTGGTLPDVARVFSAYRNQMWNALVRTLCVEFVRSDPVARNVLSFKVDVRALCEAIPKKDVGSRGLYSAYLLTGSARSNGGCPAHGDGFHGSVIGAGPSTQHNTSAQVAATSAAQIEASGFYIEGSPQMAAIGEVTLRAARIGDPLVRDWTIADLESSGVCDVPGRPRHPVITTIRIGEGYVGIVDDPAVASHRIVRRVDQSYGFGIEPNPNLTLLPWEIRTIPRSNLRLLAVENVSELRWRDGTLDDDPEHVVSAACRYQRT